MNYIEDICNLDKLYQAFLAAKKESYWKESVQKYELNILSNLYCLQQDLLNNKYSPAPFFEFKLQDRGKIRWIKANTIRDRIVRHALCDNVLNPLLEKSLIYDNGASIKGKGISFTRKRLETHLHRFFRKERN